MWTYSKIPTLTFNTTMARDHWETEVEELISTIDNWPRYAKWLMSHLNSTSLRFNGGYCYEVICANNVPVVCSSLNGLVQGKLQHKETPRRIKCMFISNAEGSVKNIILKRNNAQAQLWGVPNSFLHDNPILIWK